MTKYRRSQVSNEALSRSIKARVARDCAETADLLADLGEFDARKLYRPAGHSSMFVYCVGELNFSEDSAYKRITAARAARRFPAVFPAVAEGRLHLSAVVMLSPYLTTNTADDLIAAATHKSKSAIALLLADRFPRPDVPSRVRVISLEPATQPVDQLAPGPVELAFASNEQLAPGRVESLALAPAEQLAPGRVETLAFASSEQLAPRSKLTPLSAERIAVQFTMSRAAHDKLQHAQALLSHQLPSGDMGEVFELALDALIPQLEKRKFAATEKPRMSRRLRRSAENTRHIPASVKRAVWRRDNGQCTFVSDAGHRCTERRFLEFDHVHPVARGGRASVAMIRLRCRAHNQYEAERAFGAEFMRHKRERAREAAALSAAPRDNHDPPAGARRERAGPGRRSRTEVDTAQCIQGAVRATHGR